MSIARLSLVALSLSSLFCFGGCATLQEDGGRDFQATWPDEVQAPTGTVRMLRQVERIEVSEAAERVLSHARILAVSRIPLQVQKFQCSQEGRR